MLTLWFRKYDSGNILAMYDFWFEYSIYLLVMWLLNSETVACKNIDPN